MASADSFAIELPPVPTQPLEAMESGIMPSLFDDALLGGLVAGPTFSAPAEDGAASLSPSGYSPSHAVPSPQPPEFLQGPMESSSDELAQRVRGAIIQKLPTKKRTGLEDVSVKLEDDGSGSGLATPDDERDQKRQRRLMKNRESAQLSRQRKKVYVEELEKKVAQLQRTSDEALKKNAALSKDNAALREEVARLTLQLKAAQGRPITSSKSAKAAGVCLLVVLFSFGIIFNSGQRLPFEDSLGNVRARHYIGRTLASTDMKRVTKESDKEEEMTVAAAAPSVAAPVHIEVKASSDEHIQQAQAVDAKLQAPVKGSIANIGSIAERASKINLMVASANKDRRTVLGGDSKDRTSAHLAVDALDPTNFQELKRRKTAVKVLAEHSSATAAAADSTDEEAPAVILGSEKKAELVPVKEETNLVPLHPYHVQLPSGAATRTRPVTQYFYCPDAQRLTPTNGEPPSDVPPNYVALLIPGEMLNSTFAPPNSLVEVTCSVASMNVFPNYRAPLPEQEQHTALQRT